MKAFDTIPMAYTARSLALVEKARIEEENKRREIRIVTELIDEAVAAGRLYADYLGKMSQTTVKYLVDRGYRVEVNRDSRCVFINW